MKTKPRPLPRKRRIEIEIKTSQHRIFADANRLIEEWSGRAPGTEGLFAWHAEGKLDAAELAEMYCVSVHGFTIDEIDALLRGEKWCWEI